MSTRNMDVVFATRSEWMAFIKMVDVPQVRREPQRDEERNSFQMEVAVMMDVDGETVRRHMTMMNLSNSGLMLKSDQEFEKGMQVLIEVNPDGKPFHVVGVVRHCTQTLGGNKVGVRLIFS